MCRPNTFVVSKLLVGCVGRIMVSEMQHILQLSHNSWWKVYRKVDPVSTGESCITVVMSNEGTSLEYGLVDTFGDRAWGK